MNLLESFISSRPSSAAAASAVRDYFEWQMQHRVADFIPSADDDVDLRTYLLDLRTNGADRAALEEQVCRPQAVLPLGANQGGHYSQPL